MPAPISVIIPTLNSSDHLPKCLSSLAEALTHGLITEVIFADGGSTDATELIAEEVGAEFVSSAKGRGTQMHNAALGARGEWLLFLHSDSVLENSWADHVAKHISARNEAAYFKLHFDQKLLPAKIVAWWANFRSRRFGLPYGDQGLLISRKMYEQTGGYPQISLMEDVAIAKKLRGNLTQLPIAIETSAEKYVRNGWINQSTKNFALLVRFMLGANPDKLATKYYN